MLHRAWGIIVTDSSRTLVPQEVAVGMGVLAAARREGTWPTTLWPIQVNPDETDHLIIPRLDLGWDSLRTLGSD